MKRRKIFKLLFLLSCVALLSVFSLTAAAEDDVAYINADMGGSVTLTAYGTESSSHALWIKTDGGGGFSVCGEGTVDFTENGKYVSRLIIENVSEDDTKGKYVCLFSGDDTPLAKVFALYGAPSVSSGNMTDCFSIEEGRCALCQAEINGYENYPFAHGWYSVGENGELNALDDGFFTDGNLLFAVDVKKAGGKKKVAYAFLDKDGNTVASKVFTISSSGESPSPYIKMAMLCGDIKSEEIYSGEGAFYTVQSSSFEYTGSTVKVTVTIKANEGYFLQHTVYKFTAQYGKYVLTAKTDVAPAYFTDEITLCGTFDISENTDTVPTVETAEKTEIPSSEEVGATYCVPPYMEISETSDAECDGAFFGVKDGKITYYTVKSDANGVSPTFSESAKPLGNTGVAFEYNITATEGSVIYERGSILEYIGLTLSKDGRITGNPVKEGTYSVAIRAEKNGKIAEKNYVFTFYPQKESYSISFVKNGGTGNIDDITVDGITATLTIPECTLTPPGKKVFLYWEYEGEKYLPGEEIKVYTDMAFIACYGEKAEETTAEKETETTEKKAETTEKKKSESAVTDKKAETASDETEKQADATRAEETAVTETEDTPTAEETDGRTKTEPKTAETSVTDTADTGEESVKINIVTEDGTESAVIIIIIVLILAALGILAAVLLSKKKH